MSMTLTEIKKQLLKDSNFPTFLKFSNGEHAIDWEKHSNSPILYLYSPINLSDY